MLVMETDPFFVYVYIVYIYMSNNFRSEFYKSGSAKLLICWGVTGHEDFQIHFSGGTWLPNVSTDGKHTKQAFHLDINILQV